MGILVVALVLIIFNFIVMPKISNYLSRSVSILVIDDFLLEKIKFSEEPSGSSASGGKRYLFKDMTGGFPKKNSVRKRMSLEGILHEKTSSEKRLPFSKKELLYKYSFILKSGEKVFLGEIETHISGSFTSYIIYITKEINELRGATPLEYRKYLKGVVTHRRRSGKAFKNNI